MREGLGDSPGGHFIDKRGHCMSTTPNVLKHESLSVRGACNDEHNVITTSARSTSQMRCSEFFKSKKLLLGYRPMCLNRM